MNFLLYYLSIRIHKQLRTHIFIFMYTKQQKQQQ